MQKEAEYMKEHRMEKWKMNKNAGESSDRRGSKKWCKFTECGGKRQCILDGTGKKIAE